MRLPKIGRWAEMITYDYAVCEICGKKYQSVSSHIRKEHGIMDINEYKDEYGYNHNQPLESGKLQEKRSKANLETKGYKNIIDNKKNRFKKGKTPQRTYNEQHLANLKYIGLANTKDPEIKKKRIKTLKKTIKERAIRDSKGRFKGFKEKA